MKKAPSVSEDGRNCLALPLKGPECSECSGRGDHAVEEVYGGHRRIRHFWCRRCSGKGWLTRTESVCISDPRDLWRARPKPRVWRSKWAPFADESFERLRQYGRHVDCEMPPLDLIQDARDYVASLFDGWPGLALPRIDIDRQSPGIVVTWALAGGTSALRFSGSDVQLTRDDAHVYDGDFRDLERVGKWIMNGPPQMKRAPSVSREG